MSSAAPLTEREKRIVDATIQWHEENPFGVLPPEEMYDEIEYVVNNAEDDLPPAA